MRHAALTVLMGLLVGWSPQVGVASDEVVVRAPRVPEGVPASATVSIIRLSALRARYVTPAEMLDIIPGLNVRSFGGPGQPSHVQVRGASATQVLVLVDGVRLNPILGGAADLSLSRAHEMDRIEIIRGPAAGKFGADALGGVVRFVRDPAASRIRLWSTLGSFGTARIGMFLRADAVESSFELDRTAGDFRFYDAQRHRFERRANNDNTTGSMHMAWRGDTASVALRAVNIQSGSPGFTEFPTPEARRAQTRATLQAQWRFRAAGGTGIVETTERYERSRYFNPNAFLGGGVFESLSAAHGTTLASRFTRVFGQHLTLASGAEVRWERLKEGEFGQPSRVVGSADAGVTFTYKRLDASVSARMEGAARHAPRALPTAGLRVQLPWSLFVRASAGRNWRLPAFIELYHPDLEFIGPNPDLEPEDGVSFDLGAGGFWRCGSVEATWFGQVIEQGILWAPVSAFRYEPVNTGPVRLEGVELAGSVTHSGIEATASYTRLATLRVDTGQALPSRPAHRIGLQARYDTGRLGVFGELAHTSPSFADFHGNLVVPGGTGLSAGVSFGPTSGATFTLEAKNLLDQDLRDSRYFPLPGRSIYATILWEL